MPQNNQTLLEKTVADQWQTLPSGLTAPCRIWWQFIERTDRRR